MKNQDDVSRWAVNAARLRRIVRSVSRRTPLLRRHAAQISVWAKTTKNINILLRKFSIKKINSALQRLVLVSERSRFDSGK